MTIIYNGKVCKPCNCKKPTKFGVDVTSFVYIGSMGAEHYYAEAWYGCVIGHHEQIKEKMTYPMSAKTARYLNKKDDCGTFFRYKKGDTTERFDTEEEAQKRGIEFLIEKFGKDIVIVNGGSRYFDDETVIIYPKETP